MDEFGVCWHTAGLRFVNVGNVSDIGRGGPHRVHKERPTVPVDAAAPLGEELTLRTRWDGVGRENCGTTSLSKIPAYRPP